MSIVDSGCAVCGARLGGRQKKYCGRGCKNPDTNHHHQSYLAQRRRGIHKKLDLVRVKGGRCSRCGYSSNLAALEFHHPEPTQKLFQLDSRSLANRNWDQAVREARKCVLLCSNCHAEVHNPEYSTARRVGGTAMPYDAIVISAHRTQYPYPIRFKAGDRVTVGKRDDEYPGWIWTTVSSGRSAWAPEELLSVSGADAVALADYESTELNTEPDECVRVMFELLEWAWVENAAGREGWVPIKTLQPTRQRLP